MKRIETYKGHTLTNRHDSNTVLIFKGIGLTKQDIDGTEKLVKCVAGNVTDENGNLSHNGLEKAKQFIDMSYKARQLANIFSSIIREWLTEEELKEVNEKNSTEEYKGLCATHDYCDSNEAMVQAFLKSNESLLKGNVEINPNDEAQTALFNTAWDLAKNNKFQKI